MSNMILEELNGFDIGKEAVNTIIVYRYKDRYRDSMHDGLVLDVATKLGIIVIRDFHTKAILELHAANVNIRFFKNRRKTQRRAIDRRINE